MNLKRKGINKNAVDDKIKYGKNKNVLLCVPYVRHEMNSKQKLQYKNI